MARTTEPKTPPDETPQTVARRELQEAVAVDNRDTRLVVLASTSPGATVKGAKEKDVVIPRHTSTLALVPGLNFLSAEVVQRCTLPSDFDGRPLAKVPGSVLDMPEYDARSLIARSKSAEALTKWAAAETRPEIAEAIASQLPRAG